MSQIIELLKNGSFQISKYNNQLEYFKHVYEKLLAQDYVKQEFLVQILQREKNFPTGIQAKSMAIALPHVENHFVNQNALVIDVFQPPIEFHRMDNIDETLPVTICFLLLIKDVSHHMKAIQQLAYVFQDETLLDQLTNCQTKEDAIKTLEVRNEPKQPII